MEITAQKNSANIFALHSAWDGRKLRRSLKRRAPLKMDFPETLQDIVDVIVVGKNGEMYSMRGGGTGMFSEGLKRFFRQFCQGILSFEKTGSEQGGGIAVFPTLLKKPASKNKKATHAFTPRELMILESMKKGLSNKEIATALEISLYTVKDHIKHIMKKMDIHTRSGVVGKFSQN